MPRKFLEAVGVIDGANVDFSTPSPYVTGTLDAFRNGRLVTPALDDGFDEVSPAAGTFRMKAPPRTGDVLFTFYEEA